MASITKRSTKGAALTHTEMDDNFEVVLNNSGSVVALNIESGSVASSLDALNITSGSHDSRLFSLEQNVVYKAGAQTITGNKTFQGTQTFDNLVVEGTGSFSYLQSLSGSAKIIGDAFIILNQNIPTSRFAGLRVIDSGSGFTTSSFLYDGLNNQWLFQHEGSADSGSSIALFGPLNSGSLGEEIGLTENKLPRASVHGHHLSDSAISDTGTMVTVSNNFTVTGISAFQNNLNITGSLSTQGNTTLSGSTSLDGNVSITGSLVVDGSITERSSLRFKENIQPLNDSLSKINKLEGVSFTRNGIHEIGMIAEEVEKVLPEVVSYDTDNNPLGIEYSRVTSVLIEGIKDLYTIIRNQEKRINELEAKK